MKIVIIDEINFYPEHLSRLKLFGEVIAYHNTPEENEGLKRISGADIVILHWFKMPEKIINKLPPTLKAIFLASTRTNRIDLAAALARGIRVFNIPSYCVQSVAEHTFALLLNLTRSVLTSNRDVSADIYHPSHYPCFEISKKTIGIIGNGAIGSHVGHIAQNAFNMRVLKTNSSSSRPEFESLLKESDVITIHALIDQSRRLIGNKEFKLMKKGVFLINTARADIIDRKSLLRFLDNDKIQGAAFDVWYEEPIQVDDPILSCSNVILTPHIGYLSPESNYTASRLLVENVNAFLKGKPINEVTKKGEKNPSGLTN